MLVVYLSLKTTPVFALLSAPMRCRQDRKAWRDGIREKVATARHQYSSPLSGTGSCEKLVKLSADEIDTYHDPGEFSTRSTRVIVLYDLSRCWPSKRAFGQHYTKLPGECDFRRFGVID